MKNNVNEAKGWLAMVVGFVACPCHLPITLPIAISLTAGTATGAWLTNNTILLGSIMTVIFLGGLGLGYYWMNKEEQSAPKLKRGPKNVVVVTSSACDSCEETVALWTNLKSEHRFKLRIVDLKTNAGRRLAGEKNIFSTPVTIINNQITFRGTPRRNQAVAAVRK